MVNVFNIKLGKHLHDNTVAVNMKVDKGIVKATVATLPAATT